METAKAQEPRRARHRRGHLAFNLKTIAGSGGIDAWSLPSIEPARCPRARIITSYCCSTCGLRALLRASHREFHHQHRRELHREYRPEFHRALRRDSLSWPEFLRALHPSRRAAPWPFRRAWRRCDSRRLCSRRDRASRRDSRPTSPRPSPDSFACSYCFLVA